MYCHQCGKEVENTNFCPYCGAQLNIAQEKQTDYSSYQPIHPQEPYQMYQDDAPSLGFAVLSFLVPIVGLVLFVVWNKEYPLKAKSCLKGLITGIIVYFVCICCFFSAIAQYSSETYPDFYLNTVVETVSYE